MESMSQAAANENPPMGAISAKTFNSIPIMLRHAWSVKDRQKNNKPPAIPLLNPLSDSMEEKIPFTHISASECIDQYLIAVSKVFICSTLSFSANE